MTISSVSSSYLATAMLPAVRQTQAQLANLEVEASSGQYANLGLQLGDQSGYELALRTQDDLLQATTSANGVTETNLSTAQSALSSMASSAQSAAASLTALTTGDNNGASLQSIGQSNLQQFISLANTTSGDAYVFGGQNNGVAPVDDYFSTPTSSAKSSINSAFTSYFGFTPTSPQVSNISASQMQGFLSGPFAAQFESPKWGANWSTASSANTTSEISPGNTIETSTNANTSGFQQLAQGYAMLSEFGDAGLSAGAEQVLTTTALGAINQGAASITNAQAGLGQAQSRITQANSEMSDQMTLLQTQIGNMDNVDPAEVATQLSTLTSQLQTSYQLTAQIYSLSLAQYLPT